MKLPPFGEKNKVRQKFQTPLDQQKNQKSNIILEGSRHPKFMNPFEYGQAFIG